MCRRPDVLTQLSASERRRQLSAQLFGGGDESYNGVSHGSATGFEAMAGRGWENQQSEGAPISQAERVWQWQQQMAASGLSGSLQTGQKEMFMKQFGTPAMNRGPPGSNIGKATDKGQKAVRQIRSRVLDGQNNQSKSIPTVDAASWKAPTQRSIPLQAPPVLYPWGSMPPTVNATHVTPPQDVLLGAPSLGGNAAAVAAMYGPMRVANRSSNNSSWTPQTDATENLDQWLQETVQFSAPNGRKVQVSPSMAPQMQPWGMSTMDSFEMNGHENQFENQFGITESLDMDDDDLMDNDDGTSDKKIRRMLSNRASAKRSRQRRQERLGELEIQTAKLRVENTTITRKYHEAIDQARRYQDENQKLRMDLENIRSQLETMKTGARHSGTGPVKQESGKTSAYSAAVAIGVTPTKEELHNEAHSYPTIEDGFPEKFNGQESGGQRSNNVECSTKVLNSTDLVELMSPGQSINRNTLKKGSTNNNELDMEPLKETVKAEQWMDPISPSMEQSYKICSPPASGVTSSGMSVPKSINLGSPSNDICDFDGLGLSVLDTSLLGSESLGDEWFESLVQCMDV